MRPVNLLPDRDRAHVAGGRAGSSYVVLGVLGVLLAMVVGYVFSANQVNDRESQAAEARQEAGRLEQQAKVLSPFGDFSQVKETRIASVRELAKGRFDWERFMRELALILPEGSWLRGADSSATGDIEGGTGTASEGPTGQPLARLTGCTKRQSDVARMMLRLRELHRVADVTLTESKQDDSGGDAGADSCGSYYAFDVTVEFAPAANDETPPGAKRVPATLGGGS